MYLDQRHFSTAIQPSSIVKVQWSYGFCSTSKVCENPRKLKALKSCSARVFGPCFADQESKTTQGQPQAYDLTASVIRKSKSTPHRILPWFVTGHYDEVPGLSSISKISLIILLIMIIKALVIATNDAPANTLASIRHLLNDLIIRHGNLSGQCTFWIQFATTAKALLV
jgi:hypothetical protein